MFVDPHDQQRRAYRAAHYDPDTLKRIREEIMSCARAENTRKAYTQDWKNFADWCEATGCRALPAEPETVMNFAAWCLSAPRRDPPSSPRRGRR